MPQLLRLRELSAEEERAIGRLARSRTALVPVVERARIVDLAAHGLCAPGVAAALAVSERTVRWWVKRFTAQGLAGLADAPRSGRPATYPPAVVGELAAAGLTDPRALGLPFGSWALDRRKFVFQPKYAAYLNLIEPWWKILRSSALKGRRFDNWTAVSQAVAAATRYGNAHRHPFVWGKRKHHRPAPPTGIACLPVAA